MKEKEMKIYLFILPIIISTTSGALDFTKLSQKNNAQSVVHIDSTYAKEQGRKTYIKARKAHRKYVETHPSAKSSGSTPTDLCTRIEQRCLKYCNAKSDRSAGLSNSDRLSCRLNCESGMRACKRGDTSAWKVRTCSAICQGVDKHDADILIPFSSSSFDRCRDDCIVNFF